MKFVTSHLIQLFAIGVLAVMVWATWRGVKEMLAELKKMDLPRKKTYDEIYDEAKGR